MPPNVASVFSGMPFLEYPHIMTFQLTISGTASGFGADRMKRIMSSACSTLPRRINRLSDALRELRLIGILCLKQYATISDTAVPSSAEIALFEKTKKKFWESADSTLSEVISNPRLAQEAPHAVALAVAGFATQRVEK
mmetsp:Transcript_39917/g.158888  ORF Transcript_39917/g.158888 Transcript_39917/m.158888 type:complete len:139 (-) Transcript_39917:176-592(-)